MTNDNEIPAANTPPDGPPVRLQDIQLHPDFGDPDQLFNMRKWLQDAIEAKGAKQTGAGMGMGSADIDFTLEGHKFNVVIRSR